MSEVITATFEDGIFKPDHAPDLPAHARVQLVVIPEGETPEDAARREIERARDDPKRREAWDELERLWAEVEVGSGGERLSRDDLYDRR